MTVWRTDSPVKAKRVARMLSSEGHAVHVRVPTDYDEQNTKYELHTRAAHSDIQGAIRAAEDEMRRQAHHAREHAKTVNFRRASKRTLMKHAQSRGVHAGHNRSARDASPTEIEVEHVRLDRGGYDKNGRYFGHSSVAGKVYAVYYGSEREYVRAKSAKDAREQVARLRGLTIKSAPRTRVSSTTRTIYRSALAHAEEKLKSAKSIDRILNTPEGERNTRAYWHKAEADYREAATAYDIAADAAEEQGGVTAQRAAKKLRGIAANTRMYADAYKGYAGEASRDRSRSRSRHRSSSMKRQPRRRR